MKKVVYAMALIIATGTAMSFTLSSNEASSKTVKSTGDDIKIEFQNTTSEDIYLVFDKNSGYPGTGRIGGKMITSYKFNSGAVIKYKEGGKVIMTVSASDNNTRVKL